MIRSGHWKTSLACAACFITFGVFAGAPTELTPRLPAASIAVPPVAKLKAMDVDGTVHTLAAAPGTRALVLAFIATECPISSKYVPELSALAADASRHNVEFYAVLSDPTLTRKAAVEYRKTYSISFPLLFDASGELARRFKPSTTPEAFVLTPDGQVQYRGRIDDRFPTIAKSRPEATTQDLRDAVAAVIAGRAPAEKQTTPVGCVFEAWNSASAMPEKVTFARDIAPIVYSNCTTCHRPGEVAPFSLMTYADVKKHAKQIATVVDDRIMPPWKPEIGFGHFTGERRLTADQIALVQSWAKSGAPEGNPADLPPTPQYGGGWTLGTPDLVLTMPESYTVPAGGRDVYRAFVLPTNVTEDKMVVAAEFRAGNPKIVHHALLFLDNSGKARELDAADPAPGYRSFGGPGFLPSGGLGGWAPGATASFLPDGMGRPMKKGADLVVQVHYHPSGKEDSDRSTVALYFAKKPATQTVFSWSLANRQIDIPAGEKSYRREASITAPIDLTLVGIIPHMHLLGREMKAWATLPNGEVLDLIWIKDWDFKWQDQYKYETPIKLPRGTRVDMYAIYDNSADNPNNPSNPPKRVHRGEQTTDEMCICFLELAVNRNLQTAVEAFNAARARVRAQAQTQERKVQ